MGAGRRKKILPQQIREVATAVVWLVIGVEKRGGLLPSPDSCVRSTGRIYFSAVVASTAGVGASSLYPLVHGMCVWYSVCMHTFAAAATSTVAATSTQRRVRSMLAAVSPYNAGPAYSLLSLAYL